MTGNVVIVGAGQAGLSAAVGLRNKGYEGTIHLVGEEPTLPYQRPPLSKAFLLGETVESRLWLKPEEFFAQNNIEVIAGCRALSIDRGARRVYLSNSQSLGYDHMLLATGSRPRTFPAERGGDLAGVHVLRSLRDAAALKADFETSKRLLVIGGGYVGLETAAIGRKLGLDVTLVEAGDRILQRVTGTETSAYFRELHKKNGVQVFEAVGVDRLLEKNGRVAVAVLSDGTELQTDLVVVGIGVVPNVEVAEVAGLEIDNGIKTNAFCQTSDERIFAAGDCASFLYDGRLTRLESVGNAIDQAEVVADNIMGADRNYHPKPWFWSDQYDVKMQIAGLLTDFTSMVKRTNAEGSFSHWYFRDRNLVAVEAINAPRDYMVAKRMVENRFSPEPSLVADPEADLKSLLQ